MVLTALGVTRPGAPLPRQLNYESKLLFHLRAADVLLGFDPDEDVARALTGEDPAAFARASAGGQTRDSLGFLRQWGQGTPRVKMYDLDGDDYWEEPGILLEGARTNGFTRSQELDDPAWTKTRVTVSANATTAPDRTVTADKLVEDGTASSTHFFTRNTPALTNDTQQAFSVFAKAAGRSDILVRFVGKDGIVADVWFDLSAGTVGTVSGGAIGLIEKYADGWWRCMIMADSSNGGATPKTTVLLGSGGETESYNGDSSSGVYFWGMQFETDDAFPSSYVATVASTVARSADALTYTLAWLGDALRSWRDDLTIYARMARPLHADATGTIGIAGVFRLSDGTLPVILGHFVSVSRNLRVKIDTASANSQRDVAIPAGAAIEASMQVRNLRTGGSVAMDVGSGLSAFAPDATAITAIGDTTLAVGNMGSTQELYGALFELKVARGLRTLKQMQEAL